MIIRQMVAVTITISIAVSASYATEVPFIAGIKPYERPENAPVITQVKKDRAWYAHALTGVDQPYPASLHFLEDQGNWYTPFNHPGMYGRYDLRHWHTEEARSIP